MHSAIKVCSLQLVFRFSSLLRNKPEASSLNEFERLHANSPAPGYQSGGQVQASGWEGLS